jgi:hypothetical protein
MVYRCGIKYNLGSEIFSLKFIFEKSYQQIETKKWITSRKIYSKNKLLNAIFDILQISLK